MENTTKKLNLAIGVVFIAAAGILVYFAALRPDSSATDASKTPADISAATTDAVYGQLNGLTEIKLAENFESWTPEAKLQPDKTVSRRFAIQGQVDRAYLLVKASEGSNSLTKWDSFYFKLNDTGGHLFRPLSLTVPAGRAQLCFTILSRCQSWRAFLTMKAARQKSPIFSLCSSLVGPLSSRLLSRRCVKVRSTSSRSITPALRPRTASWS